MAPSFSSLPVELLLHIILRLHWKDILRLQLVSSNLNNIIRFYAAVQYHVELGIAGMLDAPSHNHLIPPAFSTTDRLARLRSHQSRWRNLDLADRHTVRHVRGGVWELAAGVLAQAISKQGEPGAREIYFKRLPVRSRGDTKGYEWVHSGYDFPIRDFTMDPSQDLLLLIKADIAPNPPQPQRTVELCIRSLHTNMNHPSAKFPLLTHELAGGARRYSHIMQICGDRLAVLHSGIFEPEIWHEKFVVYNWKTGTKEMELQFCAISSFCFLSEGYLLFAVKPFSILPAGFRDQQPRLLVCDIEQSSTALRTAPEDRNSFVAVAEFQLPEMNPYIEVLDVCIRSDPAPVHPGPGGVDETGNGYDRINPPVAFMTAPENRLFTITYHVATVLDDTGDHRANQLQSLVVFVPLRTFLSHLPPPLSPSQSNSGADVMGPGEDHQLPKPQLTRRSEIIRSAIIQTDAGFFIDDSQYLRTGFAPSPSSSATNSSSNSTSTTESSAHMRDDVRPGGIAVGWEDWMREGSRALLVPSAERVWVCNVFGSRYVYAVEPREMDAPRMARHVAVLDFNVDAVRRERAGIGKRRVGEGKAGDYDVPVDVDSGWESEDGRKRGFGGVNVNANVEVRDEPSTIKASTCGIFEEDITTNLPYRRTVLPQKMRFDGVMLTEDNIIFVNHRAPKEYEVFTL